MEENISQQITRTFPETVISDEKLTAECISICQNYNMTPEGLLWKLEALNFKSSSTRSEISPITLDSIGMLKIQLQREMSKEVMKRVQTKPRGPTTAVVNRSRMPPNMGRSLAAVTPTAPVRVKNEQAGETKVSSEPSVDFIGPSSDPDAKKKRAYRYMYEKISERSEALDRMIDDFGELIRGHYHVAELGDPSTSTDEEITVVGRIVHDAESAPLSKLTEGAMVLESSRMLSSGARVPIRYDPALKIRGNIQGASGIGIFPGALVALRGKNGGGGYFLVSEILAPPQLKPSPINSNVKIEASSDKGLSMCIACGPFTPDANLNYKPWRSLLQLLKISKPNVILLIGPFVDALHPKIKAGDTDLTPANIFRAQFYTPLRSFLNASPGSIVIMVPSIRDLVSDHAVYPQTELVLESTSAESRILLLPNPARFSINGISFATTSVDVLFHLRKEEFFKRGHEVDSVMSTDDSGTDAMANLCRHLLQQRSFYPIFPPPQDLSHEVNLDATHSNGLRLLDKKNDFAPDFLILPSRLKQFTKSVHSTTALNPSFLSKGTYANLVISGQGVSEGLKERMKVDVIKLEL